MKFNIISILGRGSNIRRTNKLVEKNAPHQKFADRFHLKGSVKDWGSPKEKFLNCLIQP